MPVTSLINGLSGKYIFMLAWLASQGVCSVVWGAYAEFVGRNRNHCMPSSFICQWAHIHIFRSCSIRFTWQVSCHIHTPILIHTTPDCSLDNDTYVRDSASAFQHIIMLKMPKLGQKAYNALPEKSQNGNLNKI